MKNVKCEIAKRINYIYSFVILALILCVFIIRGMPGVVAWSLGKLIIGPFGFILMLVSLVILVKSIFTKIETKKKLMSLILTMVLTLPALMLINVIPFKYPVSMNGEKPSATVAWPMTEESVVGWGGDSVETNAPHVIWASERWAYDIVMEPYGLGSVILEEYGIYGKDVVSPVSGVIVAAYDLEDDILPGNEEFISMEGNYVYIQIDETNTYLLLNHLKKGSVDVKVGDRVKEGDLLGKVGNSGSTSEPHLHIHHQRQNPLKTLHPILAEGLPLYFKDIKGKDMPVKGEIVIPKSR